MADPKYPSANYQAERHRIVEALTRGDLDQAQAGVEELLRRYPREFEAFKLAALLAFRRYDLQRAHDAFKHARDLAPDARSRALACAGLSEVFVVGGSPTEAEIHAREALELDADNPEFHKLLARCLLAQGRIQDGIASMRWSIAKLPAVFRDSLEVHLAGLLMQAGRADEALSVISRVGSPQSEEVGTIMTKATILQASGRFDEAAECYRRAIETLPNLPCNYALMGCLGARAAGEQGRLANRLAQVAEGDISSRIDLNFALAKAMHAAGEYDAAFQYLREGNQLKRGTLHYDAGEDIAEFEAIRQFFDCGNPTGPGGNVVAPGPSPIFIVGMPRSGTTLAEQILSAHPAVAAAGELPFIDLFARELMERHRSCRDAILSGDIVATAGRYLALLRERAQGRPYATDKMPLNFRYLGLIRLLFPHAPIIHCQRDAMDTCFSCYQQLFEGGSISFCYDLKEMGAFHRLYRNYMSHWQQLLEVPPLELRYESLVEDAERETRRLLAYCGLQFDPACLNFHTSRRTVLTASQGQVRRPLYKEAVGKWRPYEKHLGELMRGLDAAPDGAT